MATTTPPLSGSYLMPAFDRATVADAMHPGIVSCLPDASMTEVSRLMATDHVHCIAVVGIAHETAGERLVWGIISDLDLIDAGLVAGGEPTAAELAKTPIVSVEPATPLREAARRMAGQRISHVVVTDPRLQRPIGILSTLDIAGVLAWGEA